MEIEISHTLSLNSYQSGLLRPAATEFKAIVSQPSYPAPPHTLYILCYRAAGSLRSVGKPEMAAPMVPLPSEFHPEQLLANWFLINSSE